MKGFVMILKVSVVNGFLFEVGCVFFLLVLGLIFLIVGILSGFGR